MLPAVDMENTFIIKSLPVQNFIMLTVLAIVLLLVGLAVWRKNLQHVIVWTLWVGIALWFFNSSFFGFSAVTVKPSGIKIDYGILSFRNTELPVESSWEVVKYMGGIRRIKTLYYIQIGEHQSMKVRGRKGYDLVNEIGAAIDAVRGG